MASAVAKAPPSSPTVGSRNVEGRDEVSGAYRGLCRTVCRCVSEGHNGRADGAKPQHRALPGGRPGLDWNIRADAHDEVPNSQSDYDRTSYLDRLAAAGMRLSNAYAPHPHCSPTRMSIQTGKSPAKLGSTDSLDVIPGTPTFIRSFHVSVMGWFALSWGEEAMLAKLGERCGLAPRPKCLPSGLRRHWTKHGPSRSLCRHVHRIRQAAIS